MRKKTLFWVGLIFLASALQVTAQELRSDCNLAGTWYGGSDFKYLLTIIPTADNRYSVIYDPTYTLDLFGFPYNTKYTGELIRKGKTLHLNAMNILNMDSTLVPPDVSKLHIWAIRQTGKLTDCDTLNMTDVFAGGYYWTSNKVPLKDPPDYPLPDTGLETYHRLPSPR
jgi:hypothetical protein